MNENGETPPGRCRTGLAGWLLAVGAAGARPDQVVALAVFVVEEVGEDRGGEAGVVELDREIIAAFVRLSTSPLKKGNRLTSGTKESERWVFRTRMFPW